MDLGDERFQVCPMDQVGGATEQRSFSHDGEGIAEAIGWAKEVAGPGRTVAVAIESPRGAVVAGLLEAGFEVFSINPKQLDRFRDRFTVAGAKDDRLDARVLARLAANRPAGVSSAQRRACLARQDAPGLTHGG